jgi:hypothetical protein
MSNWENHIIIWIYDQLDRLFDTPPKWIEGYNFYGMDISGLDKYYDNPIDEVQKIHIDECSFIINHDNIGKWYLNEDIVDDIQIWGDNGDIYIHFEDENEWWELKIVNNKCRVVKESERIKRINKLKAMSDLHFERYNDLYNPKSISWDSKNEYIALQ